MYVVFKVPCDDSLSLWMMWKKDDWSEQVCFSIIDRDDDSEISIYDYRRGKQSGSTSIAINHATIPHELNFKRQ